MHNIETKWLYDFLTLENAAIFPVRQSVATSRNRHSAAASARWNRRLALNCLTAVTPLQLSEQGKIFHSQIRHLLQQLESNPQSCVAAAITRNVKSRLPLHTLFPSVCYRPLSARCRRSLRAIEAIDVDEAVDKLREGQSDCIFPFTTKICWKRRLTTFAYLNLNCSPSAQVTNTEKHCLTSRSHTFRY